MKYIILLLVFIILSGCASGEKKKALEYLPPDAPVQEIYMAARQFEFTPDIIHVKRGTHVILEIESLDVTHGFKLTQYRINVTIPAKTKTTVEFYAQEPGTYPFKCAHFCGVGHFGMNGKLIVE
ncbi:MAG: cupredoxin domain-containing protein [Candidatus Jettenia sp.]|nr:cupredoxin domain-containing protein [Candidatus Jettenia sp.]